MTQQHQTEDAMVDPSPGSMALSLVAVQPSSLAPLRDVLEVIKWVVGGPGRSIELDAAELVDFTTKTLFFHH